MYKRLISSKGFTLIELVIVIIVLGILAAVAIPKFVDIQKKANESQTRANLAALRSAIVTFYTKNALLGTPKYPYGTSDIQSCIQGGKIPRNWCCTTGYNAPYEVYFFNGELPAPPLKFGWYYRILSGQIWAGNNTEW